MTTIKIKGYDIVIPAIRDSYHRRAVQYRNKIIETFRKIGVTENNIDLELEENVIGNTPAVVSWYIDKHHLYYSYKILKRYIENLHIVFKVIEHEVNAVLSGKKSIEDFMNEFMEEHDVEEKRKEARAFLGVEHHVTDLKIIDVKYKELAKKNHPDMPGGSTETFKKINNAHKILKRELQ